MCKTIKLLYKTVNLSHYFLLLVPFIATPNELLTSKTINSFWFFVFKIHNDINEMVLSINIYSPSITKRFNQGLIVIFQTNLKPFEWTKQEIGDCFISVFQNLILFFKLSFCMLFLWKESESLLLFVKNYNIVFINEMYFFGWLVKT